MEWPENNESTRSQFATSIQETGQETLSSVDRHYAHSDKILDLLDNSINTRMTSIENMITDSKREIEKRIENIEKLFDDATFNRRSTKWIIGLAALSAFVSFVGLFL